MRWQRLRQFTDVVTVTAVATVATVAAFYWGRAGDFLLTVRGIFYYFLFIVVIFLVILRVYS